MTGEKRVQSVKERRMIERRTGSYIPSVKGEAGRRSEMADASLRIVRGAKPNWDGPNPNGGDAKLDRGGG